MDKLQWFKFSYADWKMGKIQRCSEVTQARFINLCCLYWSKEANLSYLDAEIEIDKEHLDVLLAKKIIERNDEHIFIKFLDEQLEGIAETSKGKSKAAKVRWAKHKERKELDEQNDTDAMHVHTDAMHVHTDAMQNNAEKRREEKKREDNTIHPFLVWFNKQKETYTQKTGGFKVLSKGDLSNLKQLKASYNNEEFESAFKGMALNPWVKENNAMNPAHFLRVDNFNRYLDQSTKVVERPPLDRTVVSCAIQSGGNLLQKQLDKGYTLEELKAFVE